MVSRHSSPSPSACLSHRMRRAVNRTIQLAPPSMLGTLSVMCSGYTEAVSHQYMPPSKSKARTMARASTIHFCDRMVCLRGFASRGGRQERVPYILSDPLQRSSFDRSIGSAGSRFAGLSRLLSKVRSTSTARFVKEQISPRLPRGRSALGRPPTLSRR